MITRRSGWRLAAFVIIVWAAFASTPELRVLLVLVDSLGLELVFILLAIQLRSVLLMIRAALAPASFSSCPILFFLLRAALRSFGALMPRRILPGTSMLLYVLSHNLWCPLARASTATSS